MSLLSKMVPQLNNDHKIPLPSTLGEAIFQANHLFCSARYGVPALLQVQILAIMHIMKHNQL